MTINQRSCKSWINSNAPTLETDTNEENSNRNGAFNNNSYQTSQQEGRNFTT